MRLCDKLRILIDERDLTQRKVAEQIGIAPSTFGGYVQGTSEPDLETLKIIASFFSVSCDYLLDVPIRQIESESEVELLRIYRAMDAEQKEIYLEQGRVFVEVNAKKEALAS